MNHIIHSIDKVLDQAGCRHRITPAALLPEMSRSLIQLRERGILSQEIFARYTRSFACVPPAGMDEVRSLIVVATPSPPLKVRFDLSGREVEAVIPPTYVTTETEGSVPVVLGDVLGRKGHALARVAVPAKLLAVRVGLAEYGRNGIAYVEGLGSFVAFNVYATDADLLEDGPPIGNVAPERLPVPPRMRECLSCAWCYHSCPTQCISPTGDRIDPLCCLTYLNEHGGDWPRWLDPEAHNCLVGCMICQRGCRANDGLIPPEVLVASFDQEETEIILKDLPAEQMPSSLREKLDLIEMTGYSTVLGRNLRALVARGAPAYAKGILPAL